MIQQLGMPKWLMNWTSTNQSSSSNEGDVLIICFGMIRSIQMLSHTLGSLEKYRPSNSRQGIVAYVKHYEHMQPATRVINTSSLSFEYVALVKLNKHYKNCSDNHMYQREANRLPLFNAWNADAVVLWRIDTELVTPMDVYYMKPWLHPERIYVPSVQNGNSVNDRFIYAHTSTLYRLQKERLKALDSSCSYGESLLFNLVNKLSLKIIGLVWE